MALWVVLSTLATYRISRMIAIEDGPGDVFSALRERLGQGTWIGRGVHCVLCLSFWIAWPIVFLAPFSSWQEYVLLSLGSAAGTVIIHKVIG